MTPVGILKVYDDTNFTSLKGIICNLQCCQAFLYWTFIIMFTCYTVLDPLTTYVGIQYYGITEGNPILSSMLVKDAPWQAWYLGISLKIVFCAAMYFALRSGSAAHRAFFYLFNFLCAVGVFVVLRNCFILAQHILLQLPI